MIKEDEFKQVCEECGVVVENGNLICEDCKETVMADIAKGETE